MQGFVSIFLTTVFFLFGIANQAQAATNEYSKNWLLGESEITQVSVDNLLAIGKDDAVFQALLEQNYAIMGVADAEGFREHLKLCDPNETHGGQTSLSVSTPFVSRKIDDLLANSKPNQEKLLQSGGRVLHINDFIDYYQGFVLLETGGPSICIQQKSSVSSAFVTLVHEMVHVTGISSFWQQSLLDFTDHRDFSERSILSFGDEVDAYQTEFEMALKYKSKFSLFIPNELRQLFDEKGVFTGHREALAKYILDSMGEESYRSGKVIEYARKVKNEYGFLVNSFQPFLRKLLVSRKISLQNSTSAEPRVREVILASIARITSKISQTERDTAELKVRIEKINADESAGISIEIRDVN